MIDPCIIILKEKPSLILYVVYIIVCLCSYVNINLKEKPSSRLFTLTPPPSFNYCVKRPRLVSHV